MTSLREIQRDFSRALAGGDARWAARHVRDAGLPAAERIAIYANNSWMAFRNALELSFPAVSRLGGADWFASVARRYRAAHPSRSGNLQHVGDGFADFLAGELGDTPHAVIADVAALEWAYQEVLVAPCAPAFDPGLLASMPEARYPDLRFPLACTCRLVRSRWPILAIWQANRDESTPVPEVDLDAGPDWLLVQRSGLEVLLHRLDDPAWSFLEALAAGSSLGAAAESGMQASGEFDLARALARFAALGALASPVPPVPNLNPERSRGHHERDS